MDEGALIGAPTKRVRGEMTGFKEGEKNCALGGLNLKQGNCLLGEIFNLEAKRHHGSRR